MCNCAVNWCDKLRFLHLLLISSLTGFLLPENDFWGGLEGASKKNFLGSLSLAIFSAPPHKLCYNSTTDVNPRLYSRCAILVHDSDSLFESIHRFVLGDSIRFVKKSSIRFGHYIRLVLRPYSDWLNLTSDTTGVHKNSTENKSQRTAVTRSQAVARIADRTAKNCRGHVT